MFSNFTDPASMTADQLQLMSQNQVLVAVAICLFLMFFRAADQHAKAKQAKQTSYLTNDELATDQNRQKAVRS